MATTELSFTELGALASRASIVVYDLEYTTWPGARERGWTGNGEAREIVQLGAVRLNGIPNLEEESSLDLICQPERNPTLSAYFTELTGITQSHVQRVGRPFNELLLSFQEFTDGASYVIANGCDADRWVENCVWHRASLGDVEGRLRSIRVAIADQLGLPIKDVDSHTLPDQFGFDMTGRAHDGLSDARAVAESIRRSMPRTLRS